MNASSEYHDSPREARIVMPLSVTRSRTSSYAGIPLRVCLEVAAHRPRCAEWRFDRDGSRGRLRLSLAGSTWPASSGATVSVGAWRAVGARGAGLGRRDDLVVGATGTASESEPGTAGTGDEHRRRHTRRDAPATADPPGTELDLGEVWCRARARPAASARCSESWRSMSMLAPTSCAGIRKMASRGKTPDRHRSMQFAQ